MKTIQKWILAEHNVLGKKYKSSLILQQFKKRCARRQGYINKLNSSYFDLNSSFAEGSQIVKYTIYNSVYVQ